MNWSFHPLSPPPSHLFGEGVYSVYQAFMFRAESRQREEPRCRPAVRSWLVPQSRCPVGRARGRRPHGGAGTPLPGATWPQGPAHPAFANWFFIQGPSAMEMPSRGRGRLTLVPVHLDFLCCYFWGGISPRVKGLRQLGEYWLSCFVFHLYFY